MFRFWGLPQEMICSLIFKRALISGCFVYVFGKSSAVCHHEQKFTKRALLEFSLTFTDSKITGCTTSAISRNRAQFPANERTFEKWMFSNLAVPRADFGKTRGFGFLEQKFARAEIGVILKLQDNNNSNDDENNHNQTNNDTNDNNNENNHEK